MQAGVAQKSTLDAAAAGRARLGRLVALVIAAGGVLAILSPWLVAVLGLPARYEMVFYFASLAAFFWALVVALRMWRGRSGDER